MQADCDVHAAFLAVAEEQFGRQVPFAFLEKVRDEFATKFAQNARAAAAHSMDRSLGCGPGVATS